MGVVCEEKVYSYDIVDWRRPSGRVGGMEVFRTNVYRVGFSSSPSRFSAFPAYVEETSNSIPSPAYRSASNQSPCSPGKV